MRKLGLIGGWREFPASQEFTIDGEPGKSRSLSIGFNTTAKVAIIVQEVPPPIEAGPTSKTGQEVLLGTVDGLERFEFRAEGPVLLRLIYMEDVPSKVWYQTDEGRNYAIDAEHLRDLTVPMIGRRERNPEMEAMRYEMRQQMAAYGQMFQEFMRSNMSKTSEAPNGNSAEKPKSPEGKPAPAGAGGEGDKPGSVVRSSAAGDPERTVPADGEVQRAADKGDPEGSTPKNP